MPNRGRRQGRRYIPLHGSITLVLENQITLEKLGLEILAGAGSEITMDIEAEVLVGPKSNKINEYVIRSR